MRLAWVKCQVDKCKWVFLIFPDISQLWWCFSSQLGKYACSMPLTMPAYFSMSIGGKICTNSRHCWAFFHAPMVLEKASGEVKSSWCSTLPPHPLLKMQTVHPFIYLFLLSLTLNIFPENHNFNKLLKICDETKEVLYYFKIIEIVKTSCLPLRHEIMKGFTFIWCPLTYSAICWLHSVL